MLVCLKPFHASCFDLLSHPFIPRAPCASGPWFAAHRWGRGRGRGGGSLSPLTETLFVLSALGEVQKELSMGHERPVQGAVGGGITVS